MRRWNFSFSDFSTRTAALVGVGVGREVTAGESAPAALTETNARDLEATPAAGAARIGTTAGIVAAAMAEEKRWAAGGECSLVRERKRTLKRLQEG